MGAYVIHIENNMGEFVATFNELVDNNNVREDEKTWFKAKLADPEDGSRCNNVKIKGILGSVGPSELKAFFMRPSQNSNRVMCYWPYP